MPKFSVKKPLTVFVAVLAIVVLGVVAYLKMTPDLMPNMDFPYVILVTTDPGASPETVEADITKPLEQSMATLDRIKNVTSSSMDSVSMVVLEFEDGVNMDTVSVDIQQKINQLKGSWSDTVGDPYVLKMNPSMLPVQVAALSYDGKDITQLSDFVNDTLSPKLEGITGVASVTVSGTVERQLHVILSQKKLDALSQRLSDAIAKQLDDAAGQLASARGQVNSAKAAIRSAEESAVRDAVTQALTTIQDSLKTMRDSRDQLQDNLRELADIQREKARLEAENLGGRVTYYDQGYSDIVESLDGYTRVSRTVLLVGLALWAVVLAAYCVLLPMQERKTALRMWTLGAKRRDIAGQIWTPSALMAAAGTVIALAVSIPGMSWATDQIQALTGSDLTLKVSTGQTVALCAGALAIALAVIALVSVSTAQRGIRKAE